MNQERMDKYHFTKVLDRLCCMIDPNCIAIEYYTVKGADKVEIVSLDIKTHEEQRYVIDITGLSLGQIAQIVIGNL